jgi:hypothetical protein
LETIRRYGDEGRFYIMLNIDDMKYWTMGAPVEETILINRKYLTPFADPLSSSPSERSNDVSPGVAHQYRVEQTITLLGDHALRTDESRGSRLASKRRRA